MKAILLAAGRGTRISRMIEPVPKSTLPIMGTPLIRYTTKMLQQYGMSVIICVGYEKEKIYKALEGLEVSYCYNPFFDVTNSIASLWIAREELNDDMLIMNADVYISAEILEMVLADQHDNVMAMDTTRIAMGDYFFKTLDSGCIKKYGKDLPVEERSGEYVGCAKITKEFLPAFTEKMNALIERQQHDLWWENIMYAFTDSDEHPIHTLDVDGRFWSEIDYFDDYERILNYLEKGDAGEKSCIM